MALVVLAFPISTAKTAEALTYEELKAWTEKQEEQQWSNQLVAYSQTLVGKRTGQCVVALRERFGVPKSEVQGAAKSTKINSRTGKVGAIVVFKRMSWAGHVGLQITPVDAQGNFKYFDSNGQLREIGAIRTINIKDRRISGYRIL